MRGTLSPREISLEWMQVFLEGEVTSAWEERRLSGRERSSTKTGGGRC